MDDDDDAFRSLMIIKNLLLRLYRKGDGYTKKTHNGSDGSASFGILMSLRTEQKNRIFFPTESFASPKIVREREREICIYIYIFEVQK